MRVAIIDESGRVLLIRESDDPYKPIGFISPLGDGHIRQRQVVIKGHEDSSLEHIVERTRVRHDNGDGTVELENA